VHDGGGELRRAPREREPARAPHGRERSLAAHAAARRSVEVALEARHFGHVPVGELDAPTLLVPSARIAGPQWWIPGISCLSPTSPSLTRNPAASSRSAPGVRMVTDKARSDRLPCKPKASRISSGSSAATTSSWCADRSPSTRRTGVGTSVPWDILRVLSKGKCQTQGQLVAIGTQRGGLACGERGEHGDDGTSDLVGARTVPICRLRGEVDRADERRTVGLLSGLAQEGGWLKKGAGSRRGLAQEGGWLKKGVGSKR